MTDDADATHSKERRAAVVAGIEALERAPNVLGIDARLLAQKSEDHRGNRLVKLEHDVADESVADDDVEWTAVARASREITAFEIAVEIEDRLLEERMRLLYDRVAFCRLLANRQESNRRIRPTENALRVNRAKPGELQQLARGAIHVGARIKNNDGVPRRWKDRRDGRSCKAGLQLKQHGRCRHLCAGVAGGNKRVG